MALFPGTADSVDINAALRLAIQAAKEGLGSDFVVWTLVKVSGADGGAGDQSDLTVEIEASVPK